MLTNILLFGATGYIGGSVLEKLLTHPRSAEFQISVLVRDPAKAEKLKAFKVTPVVGDLNSDFELITALAKDADVVFSLADSTNIPAEKAILAGAKARFETTKKRTTYIHVSGVGVIADLKVFGEHANSPVYDDMDAAQMAAISPNQPHRPVDLEILAADPDDSDEDNTGYIKSYIVLPTTVYGLATGRLVKAGIQKVNNGLLQPLIGVSLARGQGGMVGNGKNVWNSVEIDELAELFIILYDATVADPDLAHGHQGLYFAESGEAYELSDVYKIVARILFNNGKGKSAEPTSFTTEEMKELSWLGPLIGSNANCMASRARALGWNPKKTETDFIAFVKAFTEDVATSYVSLVDGDGA
ncbi:hypothetical protein DFH06DRAFT_1208945 [Mycena polygramma]|nr:hypothetical protein DFH06DRAFT_1227336 [Mycena polygramma]KAJ7649088.1 hypothetical protein DFH06DRAFT_1208945 [Mycena polygramma]